MPFTKPEQKQLATWAALCAEHVLPYFEKKYPRDKRPRRAIATCREWVRTGIFKMSVIRRASLSAHAAARKAPKESPARLAARSAGQAVATAHVATHALGASWYGLKAAKAAGMAGELAWQKRHLPAKLRKKILPNILKLPNI